MPPSEQTGSSHFKCWFSRKTTKKQNPKNPIFKEWFKNHICLSRHLFKIMRDTNGIMKLPLFYEKIKFMLFFKGL